jgi:hypothetical protein
MGLHYIFYLYLLCVVSYLGVMFQMLIEFMKSVYIMRKIVYPLLPFLLLFCISASSFAQTSTNGKYDVRLLVDSTDCNNNLLYVSVQVRASASDSTFYMGDQNYKFTYNRLAIQNPRKESALGFIGLAEGGTEPYGSHDLSASIDPGVGNIALCILNVTWTAGSNGTLVSPTWTPVTSLVFDVVDFTYTQCLNLQWRDEANNSTHFTNITEVVETLNNGQSVFNTTTDVEEKLYVSNSSCLTCSTLPVEWTSIDVERDNDDAVLEWAVASELNNAFYEVERSFDGVFFQPVGRMDGQGTTQRAADYRFVDQDVVKEGYANVFYKVRQVDTDGAFTYSETVELVLGDDRSINLSVYPNPANGQVFLEYFTHGKGTVVIELLDGNGQLITSRTSDSFQSKLRFDTSDLASGLYLFRVSNEGSVRSTKFLVY